MKENRGYLQRNTEKRGDTSPDFKGSLNISGREYWLSGWIKENEEGGKYFSLSVQQKGEPPPAQAQAAKPAQSAVDWESEVPF
jgi:uncharacterized protein (DUF736 family)